MKRSAIGLCLLSLLACVSGFAQTSAAPAGSELFLSQNDIPRVLRLAPGLAASTNKGTKETHAYLASQELSHRQISQIMTNISVAYTALKIEEYLKQVQPMLDEKSKDSTYRTYLAQTQKQLAEMTQKYQTAQKDGRSALDVNKEYVQKNQAAVEELMVHIRSMKVESLPTQ
jgi:hypothetical protein